MSQSDNLEAIRELLAADINDWREMEAHRKVRDLLRLLAEANKSLIDAEDHNNGLCERITDLEAKLNRLRDPSN